MHWWDAFSCAVLVYPLGVVNHPTPTNVDPVLPSSQALSLCLSLPYCAAPSPPPTSPSPCQTAIAFDDSRSVLFAGHSDGSVFVRRLERTPSGSMGVKLLRFCDPASTSRTPTRITCMSYDSPLDRLYTGDMSGLARVIKKVSGMPFESTDAGSKAVEDGTFRCAALRPRVAWLGMFVCPRAGGCVAWLFG